MQGAYAARRLFWRFATLLPYHRTFIPENKTADNRKTTHSFQQSLVSVGMRALLQRVKRASVVVDDAVVGQCKTGVLALVGIGSNDTEDDLEWIVKRILGTKLWENADGKPWKSKCVLGLVRPLLAHSLGPCSASHSQAHVVCTQCCGQGVRGINCFPIHVDGLRKTKSGTLQACRRCLSPPHWPVCVLQPDYHLAMSPGDAKAMFETLVSRVKSEYKDEMVAQGEFGAMMDVSLVNDGPVTLMLDSKNRENRDPPATADTSAAAAAAAASSSTPPCD